MVECLRSAATGCREMWLRHAEPSHILDALTRESVVLDTARTTVPPCPADTTSIDDTKRRVLLMSLSPRVGIVSNPLPGQGGWAILQPSQFLHGRKMPKKRAHKDRANPKIVRPTTSRKTLMTNSCMTPPHPSETTSYDELPLGNLICQCLYAPGRCPCKRWRSQPPSGERQPISALAALREPLTGYWATREEATLPGPG